MNITEVKTALPVLMRNRVVPFLWGAQGVGKTCVVKQIAKENNVGFVHLHLATQDVGDLVGLLIDCGEGRVSHARPKWMPDSGEGIIFLDELNRMHPDVMQAMFSFVTEGTIHTHKLPEGWRIVAAGNFQSNMFNVTDTSDAAWMSRFCHLDFNPTKEEFIVFAENNGALTVADFVRTNPELLETKQKERINKSMITPDRRSWMDMISRLELEESLEPMRFEIYEGIVGTSAAASYLTFKKKSEDRLSGRDIIYRYSTVKRRILDASDPKSQRFDVLNTAVEELFTMLPALTLDDLCVKNIQDFILDVPMEMSLKMSKKLNESSWKQKNKIVNNPEFVAIFKDRKLRNA